jgi:selenide,water dikinase
MGITHIDNVLMILGVCLSMNEKQKEIVTREMMKGFNDKAIEAKTLVTGGQTVMNPFPMIGGTAISTILREKVIFPNYAKVGYDVLITKPIGTQVAVNLMQWRNSDNEKWKKCLEFVTDDEVFEINTIAIESMSRLNKLGAELMHKYKVGACTDVTGFGLRGHAENLILAQKESMSMVINKIPILFKTDIISEKVLDFGLLGGYSAETSGGLLILIDENNSENYIKEMIQNNQWCWKIGKLVEGDRKVFFNDNPEVESISLTSLLNLKGGTKF